MASCFKDGSISALVSGDSNSRNELDLILGNSIFSERGQKGTLYPWSFCEVAYSVLRIVFLGGLRRDTLAHRERLDASWGKRRWAEGECTLVYIS